MEQFDYRDYSRTSRFNGLLPTNRLREKFLKGHWLVRRSHSLRGLFHEPRAMAV